MSMEPAQLSAEDVKRLIEKHLGIKAKSLDRSVAKAGRLLPKWAQRDARFLAQAAKLSPHPKLRSMVDNQKVSRAYQSLVTHLKSIDPDERRKTRLLGILGVISFNLILVVAAFIAFLWWRGYI